jgi:uncharacterized membrane protein
MNRSCQLYGTAVLLLILVDLPWLFLIGDTAQRLIFRIQGSDLKLRYIPALVVYLALAYLVTKTESPMEAFKVGVATYAVYDFTNLAMLKNYTLSFAVMDSIWGGILMALVRMALDRIF